MPIERRDRQLLIAGVLVGVAFSILGQACYDILVSGITPLVDKFWISYVKVAAAALVALFFLYLGIRELRRA